MIIQGRLRWGTFLAGWLLGASPLLVLADQDTAQTRETLQRVRRDITALQQNLRQTQQDYDVKHRELLALERDLAKLKRQLTTVEKKLRKQQSRLSGLYQKRKSLRSDLRLQREYLARQIRSSYMLGNQEYLKILLNLEDTSALGRTMVYYEYFNRARLSRISSSQQALTALVNVEQQIKSETAVLKGIREQRLSRKAELKTVTEARAQVVARLHQEIQDKENRLTELMEDQRRLEKLLADLDRAMPDILTDPGKRTPFAQLRGKMDWPTKGSLRALYGKRREASRLKWNGVMIMAQEGRDIKAISHGRVAYADFLRGYGLLLIIDHGDGYMSLYGHNQTIYKDIGEWVEAGETIASVGTSGGQKHAGLYFEIRHNGKPTNPVGWCRKS